LPFGRVLVIIAIVSSETQIVIADPAAALKTTYGLRRRLN
jgi:hypothetical protein